MDSLSGGKEFLGGGKYFLAEKVQHNFLPINHTD
jgi:hypothetical protein